MRPPSLRTRLLVGMVGLLAVGLLIADVAGMALFRAFQIQRIDEQLQLPFDATPPGEIEAWLTRACTSGTSTAELQLPTSFALLTADTDGRVLCRLPESGPTELPAQQLSEAADTGTIITLGPEGRRHAHWRARIIRMDSGYAVLAVSLTDLSASTAHLGRISLTLGLIIVAAAIVAGAALVRLELRPLTRIERTAEQIAAGDLSRRIPVGSAHTEVGRLASSLNAMLAQIEAAFAERDRTEERLRRFVADASHELRTPLATIRGHAELIRGGVAQAPADVARVAGRIEAESILMAGLVDDLLLLARLDDTRALERRPVDLLSVAVDAVADSRIRTPDRAWTVVTSAEPPWQDHPPIVLGDEARLRQVLTNLLSNAAKHTPAGTPVEVEVGVRDGLVRLSVIDHGPGLRAGNEERVFERFFREDAGRTRNQGGSGLGLAIAWSLADKHGGTLRYQPTPDGGSTFVLTLPLAE